ncbi:preprotein translocase [Streptococcus sanguinis]|uniref:preprotein translocase n=1 Tax=Streptococcus sanguinis TaxID=1305 RepID=UPI002953F995|nr:preprotein translocase [Streptococcus sanguinis]
MIGLRTEDLPDFQQNSIGFEKIDKKQIVGRKGIDGFVRIELFKKTITVRKQQTSCLLNKGEIK